MAWKTNAGDFNSLQSMLIDFPPTHYEYGTSYNTPTSRVVIAGFGENLPGVGSPRVMITPFYPQTDHFNNQRWGKWLALLCTLLRFANVARVSHEHPPTRLAAYPTPSLLLICPPCLSAHPLPTYPLYYLPT